MKSRTILRRLADRVGHVAVFGIAGVGGLLLVAWCVLIGFVLIVGGGELLWHWLRK